MKKLFFYNMLLAALLISACKEDKSAQQNVTAAEAREDLNGLKLMEEKKAEWQHGTMRLYPIEAEEELLMAHASLANVKTLDEAMQLDGFRITERKNFGRDNSAWFNGLTLVNKSNDTVFVMSGDVVTGGNQDRVNAEDLMALPGTIRNIDVFCVEHGRSSYYNPSATEEERKLGAFNGYYAIASPRVREAVNQRNQGAVWNAVAQVTKENNAETSTQTYAGLDQENEVKQKREAYVRFFTGKFESMDKVVGLIAVCNGKIIGAELFGHPNLFQRRVTALIHGYAVDAATTTDEGATVSDESVREVFQQLATATVRKNGSNAHYSRFDFGTEWLHVYKK
jgi:hypothetical protein